jgi:hypothetical protein
VATPDEQVVGEALDPEGNRVVILAGIWFGKVLRDHPDLAPHFAVVLRAIREPDHVAPDPRFRGRRHHYLRNAGPSRWLLVVLSYEQEPVLLLTTFANRKDPSSWSK